MAAIHTSLVKRRHAYTSASIPWLMDMEPKGVASSPRGTSVGWRLFHYLSGGGMRAFGRPSGHMLLMRRQTRFLWLAAAVAAAWLVFLFV